MFKTIKTLLLGGALLVSATALAQQDYTVCGISLDTVDAFNWSDFKSGPGESAFAAGSRLATVGALGEELNAKSASWPQTLADHAKARLNDFADGTIVLGDWIIEKGDFGRDQFVFDGNRKVQLPADADACEESAAMRQARAEFAQFVRLVSRAGNELLVTPRQGFSTNLAALETLYDRYLFEGMPMYPWEAAVNSWFLTDKHIANGPPRSQLVLMHPSVGLLANVESHTDGDLGGTLLVEAIGFVRYSSNYRSRWGASIVGAFPTDREPGIGIGLNYRQFKLGVTWHDDPDGAYDGAAVFLGVDLYQFVGKQKRRYDGYRQRLDELLVSDRDNGL
ncbi:hypothetical protein [Marinobacter sp. SS13-12]|uniref:hypothetical protein n=1 Tax=Marinobacter sp. SS13-12 TaxID=3050451 RepID=UPI00255733F3|nr:hypothetical protein [Marinobacter sp. SS13-12]MDK8462035.1 hypothetical protein [Marinobacter sp. SS13-12]